MQANVRKCKPTRNPFFGRQMTQIADQFRAGQIWRGAQKGKCGVADAINNIKQDTFFMVSLEWPNLANLKSEYILAYYPNRLEILCKLTKHSLLSFTVGGATHQKGR
jgi:hypothetical protein